MLLHHVKLFVFLCLMFFIKLSSSAPVKNWQLQYSDEKIKLYNRNVNNSPFMQTKAVVEISSSLADLLPLFGNGSQCLLWHKRCETLRTIKKVSDHELYAYSVLNLPWPIADRDFVFHSLITVDDKSNTTTLTFSPVEGIYPETKYVRAQSNITYSVKVISNTSCILTIKMHTEFGGNISAKFINSILIEELHQDINKLLTLLNEK